MSRSDECRSGASGISAPWRSSQILLRGVGFGLGLFEIQTRLVVGMLGTVRAGEQAFHREQLHAGVFLVVRTGVEAGGRGISDHSFGWGFERQEQRNFRGRAFADTIERAHVIG